MTHLYQGSASHTFPVCGILAIPPQVFFSDTEIDHRVLWALDSLVRSQNTVHAN